MVFIEMLMCYQVVMQGMVTEWNFNVTRKAFRKMEKFRKTGIFS